MHIDGMVTVVKEEQAYSNRDVGVFRQKYKVNEDLTWTSPNDFQAIAYNRGSYSGPYVETLTRLEGFS